MFVSSSLFGNLGNLRNQIWVIIIVFWHSDFIHCLKSMKLITKQISRFLNRSRSSKMYSAKLTLSTAPSSTTSNQVTYSCTCKVALVKSRQWNYAFKVIINDNNDCKFDNIKTVDNRKIGSNLTCTNESGICNFSYMPF